ncbi:NAD(P)H-binding protein [Paenibacillus kobensis]|uniref:NAD(P)H-binding protein n=1 Tax=Paenibacillus kobensis TaxID=59841 RepID=UPI000FD8E571|nr:NAD(P)H-binding protein [Paenibacillus kobensis]
MIKHQGATAIVAGATGLVGRELVNMLLNHPAYNRVVVLVRREIGLSHPRLEERHIVFDRMEKDVEGELFKGADVFCSLGTTIKQAGSQEAFRRVDHDYPLSLGRVARQNGAASFIIVSAMGSSDRSRMFYNRVKGETERDLALLRLSRLVVLKPSLMFGDRTDKRPGERAAIVIFRLFGALMIGPFARYKAIKSRKVAQAMILAARREGPSLEVLESEEISALAASV